MQDHSTALTWALYEGHTEIAKLLISKDANIHNQEDVGHACTCKLIEIMMIMAT